MRTMLNSGLRASDARRPRHYTKPQPAAPQLGADGGDAPDPADPVVPAGADVDDTEPQDEPVAVPEGMTKVKDLEEWVGSDPERAQAVLDRELAQSYQRPTVVSGMEAIVAQHDLI